MGMRMEVSNTACVMIDPKAGVIEISVASWVTRVLLSGVNWAEVSKFA